MCVRRFGLRQSKAETELTFGIHLNVRVLFIHLHRSVRVKFRSLWILSDDDLAENHELTIRVLCGCEQSSESKMQARRRIRWPNRLSLISFPDDDELFRTDSFQQSKIQIKICFRIFDPEVNKI